MKSLLLIDANSLVHRCFHALPPLTTPDGRPIQAIYGLASVFLRLWREERPEYAAALFDRPEPTFREKKYKEYKAHRPPTPDTLISQIIEAHTFFDRFGLRTFEIPGLEADDLIATLAEKFRGVPNVKIIILTGDLDTLQLVEGDAVVVRTFRKGISDTFTYDEQAVEERYGLKPDQLVDYKAMVGDPSDNVKGVAGVGPKTASDALKKFGTLENLYRNLTKDQKLEKKLAGSEEQAKLSKSLVILTRTAPIKVQTLEDVRVPQSQGTVREYFQGLGFESLVKRLDSQTQPPPAVSSQPGMFNGVLKKKAADEKIPAHLTRNAVFIRDGANYTRDFSSPKLKVGFELKALLKKLWSEGKNLAPPYFDLSVAFWLMNPDFKRYEPENISKEFLKREWSGSIRDLYDAWRFSHKKLRESELALIFKTIEMPTLRILADIEIYGIFVNIEKLKILDAKIQARLAELSEHIYREAGSVFNINSSQQLSRILFTKLHLKGKATRRTAGGAQSTRADALEDMKDVHPIIPLILEYRDGFKMRSTYVRPFQELAGSGGRLHTEFIQTGTATGRLSSREPNLQNIPRGSAWAEDLRGAFESAPGFSLVAFDYSQIELRILASLSQDQKLIDAFKQNLDIHRATAAAVFDVPLDAVQPEMRRVAKILNFGLMYGMGVSSFSRVSGLRKDRAAQFIGAYFREFQGVKVWQETLKEEARASGYVQTLTGRRRYVPGLSSGSPKIQAEAERAAVNHPIQGTNADIIKIAMIKVKAALEAHGWWGKSARLILSIHDELLFEVADSMMKKVIPMIRDVMEKSYNLNLPVEVDVSAGKTWSNLQAYAI